jgi:hypothetical protein
MEQGRCSAKIRRTIHQKKSVADVFSCKSFLDIVGIVTKGQLRC